VKRRIIYALTGLALIASFTIGSPSDASANSACSELGWAMGYHLDQGNFAYVRQLATWAANAGCDFV
jgi:hypothetical protein